MSRDRDKSYYPALDEAITLYLKRNNVTQAALASEMGMSENTFSWKRRGIRDWSMTEAVELCDILGITLDEAVAEPEAA